MIHSIVEGQECGYVVTTVPGEEEGQSSRQVVQYNFDEPNQINDDNEIFLALDRNQIPGPLNPIAVRTETPDCETVMKKYDSSMNYDKYNEKYNRWLNKFRSNENLWSESDISNISDIKSRTFEKTIVFLQCTVTRLDGTTQTITDADFPNLHPNDWKDIMDKLGGIIGRGVRVPGPERALHGRMKQLLRDYVDQHITQDYECRVLWAVPPEMSFRPSAPPPGLDEPEGRILTEPEKGLVYHRKMRNITKKCFFRFSEMRKYSNSDLQRFLSIMHRETQMIPIEERLIQEEAIQNIKNTIAYRNNFAEMKKSLEDHFQPM